MEIGGENRAIDSGKDSGKTIIYRAIISTQVKGSCALGRIVKG